MRDKRQSSHSFEVCLRCGGGGRIGLCKKKKKKKAGKKVEPGSVFARAQCDVIQQGPALANHVSR